MRPIGLLRTQQRSTPNVSALRKSEKTTLGKDQWFVITGFKVQHAGNHDAVIASAVNDIGDAIKTGAAVGQKRYRFEADCLARRRKSGRLCLPRLHRLFVCRSLSVSQWNAFKLVATRLGKTQGQLLLVVREHMNTVRLTYRKSIKMLRVAGD